MYSYWCNYYLGRGLARKLEEEMETGERERGDRIFKDRAEKKNVLG